MPWKALVRVVATVERIASPTERPTCCKPGRDHDPKASRRSNRSSQAARAAARTTASRRGARGARSVNDSTNSPPRARLHSSPRRTGRRTPLRDRSRRASLPSAGRELRPSERTRSWLQEPVVEEERVVPRPAGSPAHALLLSLEVPLHDRGRRRARRHHERPTWIAACWKLAVPASRKTEPTCSGTTASGESGLRACTDAGPCCDRHRVQERGQPTSLQEQT